jgi:hypothetical protein
VPKFDKQQTNLGKKCANLSLKFVVLIVGNGKVGGPGKTNTVSGPKEPIPELHEFHPALHDG